MHMLFYTAKACNLQAILYQDVRNQIRIHDNFLEPNLQMVHVELKCFTKGIQLANHIRPAQEFQSFFIPIILVYITLPEGKVNLYELAS